MPREPDDEDAAGRPSGGWPGSPGEGDEPVTGAPAGASTFEGHAPDAAPTAEPAGLKGSTPAANQGAGGSTPTGNQGAGGSTPTAAQGTGGSTAGGAQGAGAGATRVGGGRRAFGLSPAGRGPLPPSERRRRRFFVAGISIAAVVIVVALCAGGISVVAAVNGVRDRATDVRAGRQLRENDCLDLETRLNKLPPPGSTSTPSARATAIRNENAAVRIYLDQLRTQRDEDDWRQLIDARSVFADALDKQAQTRTPAFYVAPRATDGSAVTDELEQWSPAPCAGSIHRLAAPQL